MSLTGTHTKFDDDNDGTRTGYRGCREQEHHVCACFCAFVCVTERDGAVRQREVWLVLNSDSVYAV